MRRLFLLEAVPSDLSVSPRDTVVAVTPQAAYALDKAGTPHRIPADFGTEERLRRAEPAFLTETRSWLNRLDDLLQDSFPVFRSPGQRPALLYAYHWKTLLDNLYARGLELDTLLAEGTEEVVFAASQQPIYPPVQFLPSCRDPRGLWALWARRLCAQRSVPLREIQVPSPDPLPPPAAAHPLGGTRRRLLQSVWQARGLSGKWRSPSQRLILLFLESDYLGYLLKESLCAGHRCLLAKESWLPQVPPSELVLWSRTAQALSATDSPVWNWPDRWLGVPVASLLGAWLARWISQDLRALAASLHPLAARYDALGVDFVLTPFLVEPVHFAAVAACGLSKKAQSVMIADGDGPDESPDWDLTQLSQTQHYFVLDREFAAYSRRRSDPAGGAVAQVHIGSDRWQTYPRLARKPWVTLQRWESSWSLRWRQPPLPLPDSRPLVVLPLAKPEPDIRRLHRFEYDETWYYRLLKRWIEVLAEDSRYIFVIKPVRSPYAREGTAERIVRDQRKDHLLVSRSPFPLWLPWANRVVLDHPSTPMYETALAGVPMRLILPRTLSLRPDAIRPFESCIAWYDEPQEAVAALRRYLDAPHTGAPHLRVPEASILEALPRLRAHPPSHPDKSAAPNQQLEVVG